MREAWRASALAAAYVEEHLTQKLSLDAVAGAAHYSKFHLHRLFAAGTGMTLHEYIRRRQLTEAARRLTQGTEPVARIALEAGYESQQAFTDGFCAMYKLAPARYRAAGRFYPLMLPLDFGEDAPEGPFGEADIAYASASDAPRVGALARLCVDGYPYWARDEFDEAVRRGIAAREALILGAGERIAGAMLFSRESGRIAYLAVHPRYRRLDAAALLVGALADTLPRGREISITTFRSGDRADHGYRAAYARIGFAGAQPLVEYGYPTQKLVLLSWKGEVQRYESGR